MPFSDTMIQAVWEKGSLLPGQAPDVWRRDEYNNVIGRHHYGDRHSAYGWEIHHLTPEARGGTDDYANLAPLHWRKNAELGGRLSDE